MTIKISKIKYIGFYYCIIYTMTRACLGSLFGKLPFLLFIVLLCLYILAYILTYKFQKQKIVKNNFYFGYMLYILFIIMSILVIRNSSTYAIYEYVFYLLWLFPVCYMINGNIFENILKCYEIMGIVLSVEAIWEFTTGNLPYRVSVEQQVIRRACGLVGTPLTLGMIFACITLIAIYMGSINSKKHFIVAAFTFIGLLMTQSRGPLVGFVVGFIILGFLEQYKKTKKIYNVFLKSIFKIVVFILILMILFELLYDKIPFIQTIYLRIQTITAWNGTDNSNDLRQHYWQVGIEYFKQHPILGYGVSTSGTHSSTGINVESGVIKKFMETGIIGATLYYVTFGGNFLSSIKKCVRKDVKYYPLATAIIITIFIENIVLQIIESSATFMLFIIFFTYLYMAGGGKILEE